jgi:O-antigen/teichoic acid export membrane protein
MLNLLLQRVDLFILSHFAGSATVGVYSIAQNIAFTFKKIRQSFDPIFIPVISASHQLKDRDALLEQYRNVARWVLILNTALFGLTVFAGHTILRIFGGEFVAGATALIILTAAVIINSFLGISELFILIDRPYINLINTIGSIGAAIILNYALVPEFGMLGACMAFLATYLLMNAARIIEVRLLYRLHPFTRYHARALLAAVPSFAAALFIREAIPLTHGVTGEFAAYLVFFLLYVVSLVLMGMAKEEETFLAKIISLFKKNDSENM